MLPAAARRAAAAVAPAQPKAHTASAATKAFVAAFNDILLIGAIVLFAGAALALGLVRRRDFIGAPTGDRGSGIQEGGTTS